MRYTDEYGQVWEVNYVVTQTEAEGPEYVEYRKADTNTNDPWIKLPPWALVPKEMMEFWHGPVIGASKVCQHCGQPPE
jgi:hypothetical protein